MSTEPLFETPADERGLKPAATPERDPRLAWPSVTRILKLAGLSPWQDVTLEQLRRGVQHGLDERTLRYILQGVRPEVLDAKAELGRMVHDAIYDIERGLTERWWEDLEITPYVLGYLAFKQDMHYAATSTEQKVYHETYQYQGTYDSCGMCGKFEALIDVKTTVQMAPDLPFQLAGYEMCLAPNPKRARFGVQLKKDATYQLHEYNDKNDSKIFLAALAIANTKKGF